MVSILSYRGSTVTFFFYMRSAKFCCSIWLLKYFWTEMVWHLSKRVRWNWAQPLIMVVPWGFFCAASCLLHGSLSIKQEEAREKERGSNAPVCLCDVARSTHIQFQEVGISSECKARCHQDVAWKSWRTTIRKLYEGEVLESEILFTFLLILEGLLKSQIWDSFCTLISTESKRDPIVSAQCPFWSVG